MKIHILDKTKKKKIIEKVSYLGIQKIPYMLIQTGVEKFRIFSGNFSNPEIMKVYYSLPIEGVGLYFGKAAGEDIRLSVDALHILKNQINKNIMEVNNKQEEEWFLGRDIELTDEQMNLKLRGFVAVKSGEDFIGTGKIHGDGKIISNFLPKERRKH